VLLTTQYMEEAEYLADQIVLLDTGCVVASGTADQLKDRIGSDILEVRVADSADVERAAALLEPFGQGGLQVDRDLKKISVRVNGRVDALLAAGRDLEERGVVLDDLRIRRPSLDDVFLSFTGPPTPAAAADALETLAPEPGR
jgi:ABC-2 type transport system ATP-binding protein